MCMRNYEGFYDHCRPCNDSELYIDSSCAAERAKDFSTFSIDTQNFILSQEGFKILAKFILQKHVGIGPEAKDRFVVTWALECSR